MSSVESYRRELHAHCYRMMGSTEDAEDLVQETFVRAWKRRETLQEHSALRAWLYKIATNACLDVLKKKPRRMIPRTHQAVSTIDERIPPDITEPVWLQPYPDELFSSDGNENPDVTVEKREHITLAFIAVLQLLPPRQRTVLLLRDVLEWKTREVALLLDATESAIKSTLHRARMTLAKHQNTLSLGQNDLTLDESLRTQLDNYVRAWESANIDAFMQLLKEDATFSMPPIPSWYRGTNAIRALIEKTIFGDAADKRWVLLPTRANGQSAFGLYQKDEKQGVYQFYGIQVITFEYQEIADIITFRHRTLFEYFNLPSTLPITATANPPSAAHGMRFPPH